MLMLAELKGCVMWFLYLSDLLKVRHNSPTPHLWAVPKMSVLNRVKLNKCQYMCIDRNSENDNFQFDDNLILENNKEEVD